MLTYHKKYNINLDLFTIRLHYRGDCSVYVNDSCVQSKVLCSSQSNEDLIFYLALDRRTHYQISAHKVAGGYYRKCHVCFPHAAETSDWLKNEERPGDSQSNVVKLQSQSAET